MHSCTCGQGKHILGHARAVARECSLSIFSFLSVFKLSLSLPMSLTSHVMLESFCFSFFFLFSLSALPSPSYNDSPYLLFCFHLTLTHIHTHTHSLHPPLPPLPPSMLHSLSLCFQFPSPQTWSTQTVWSSKPCSKM